MDKKYRLNGLRVEITRKCNKKCAHCIKGEAQESTISEQIIDRVFDGLSDVQHVILGNGEALLEIEKIEYFITKLMESNWTTKLIEITTNGTILDARIVNAFESFCRSSQGRHAVIRISNDQFHEKEEYESAYTFYKALVDEVNLRLWSAGIPNGITLEYVITPGTKLSNLRYEGRAVELVDGMANAERYYVHGKNVKYSMDYNHRIKIVGNTIPCLLTVSSNGNIGYDEGLSYVNEDRLSIGNVCEMPITEIINRHNDRCLVLCSETNIFHIAKNVDRYSGLNREQKAHIKLVDLINKRVVELRYKAKERYEDIPAHVIIEKLPFISSKPVSGMLDDIYKHSPLYTPELLTNIKKYDGTKRCTNYRGALIQAVINYLNDRRIERKYPLWLFGNEDDIQEYLHFKFHDLNQQYKADPTLKTDSHIFACELLDNDGVDYSEQPVEDVWNVYQSILENAQGSEFVPKITEILNTLKTKIDVKNWTDSKRAQTTAVISATIEQEFEKFAPWLPTEITPDILAALVNYYIFES